MGPRDGEDARDSAQLHGQTHAAALRPSTSWLLPPALPTLLQSPKGEVTVTSSPVARATMSSVRTPQTADSKTLPLARTHRDAAHRFFLSASPAGRQCKGGRGDRGRTGVFDGLTLIGREPKMAPLQFKAAIALSAITNSTKAMRVE